MNPHVIAPKIAKAMNDAKLDPNNIASHPAHCVVDKTRLFRIYMFNGEAFIGLPAQGTPAWFEADCETLQHTDNAWYVFDDFGAHHAKIEFINNQWTVTEQE